MNKSSKKIYSKALKLYQQGRIDKAIELCEKGISMDMKNSPFINLKGLLLYLKGDLKGAKALWQINKDYNSDSVAKKYIEDIKEDELRLEYYNKAVDLCKNLSIKEAISLLNKSAESDFNSINVCNLLTFCYIKCGDYKKAMEYINKVFSLDIYNKTAIENKKLLMEYGAVKKDISYKKIALGITIPMAIIAAVLIFKYGSHYINDKKILHFNNKSRVLTQNNGEAANKDIDNPINNDKPAEESNKDKNNIVSDENKKDENKNIEETKEIVEEKPIEVFPVENFKKDIEDKDFEALYKTWQLWKDKTIANDQEKALFSKGEDLLKREGSTYFYNIGLNFRNSKDYNNACRYLAMAYELGDNGYLYPHIIYMLAYSYEKTENNELAIKYYDIYIKNYNSGGYADAALYNISLLLSKVDMQRAKENASTLINKYPNSIYNNAKIQAILNQ